MVSNHEYERVLNELKGAEAINEKLRRRIEDFVCEFRFCRWCKNLHGDCTTTGAECNPKWRGL